MRLQPSSQVQSRPIDWLWLNRLAFGKLAILDGDPSLGKSFIALDLCARLSTGRPMPDGSPGPGIANSMVLFSEDGSADTVRPRLTLLGADPDRVFLPNLDDDDEGLWTFPKDLARLDQCIRDCEIRLVVIDPIMAFLDASINSGSDQSLRRMLTPLKALAEKLRCAILFLRHLNKNLGMRGIYRGTGSIAFSAACRFEWLVTELPEADKLWAERRCVLAQFPSNLTGPQSSLVYEVRESAEGEGDLLWNGVADWTAKQLLSQRRPRRHPRRDRAAEFLRALLSDGPKTSRQIWAANETRGFSVKTFQAACARLGIRFHKVWNGGDPLSYWLLPGQEPPPPTPRDPSTDLMPFFQEQLKRLPPESPLDDVA